MSARYDIPIRPRLAVTCDDNEFTFTLHASDRHLPVLETWLNCFQARALGSALRLKNAKRSVDMGGVSILDSSVLLLKDAQEPGNEVYFPLQRDEAQALGEWLREMAP